MSSLAATTLLRASAPALATMARAQQESPQATARDAGAAVETREELERLRARDAEVRAHEAAHLAAAGDHALGSPTYTYQRGPDGRQYAVGGRVQIDTSPVRGDPQATILKARQIRRAALAPKEPSAQDRTVAQKAVTMEQRALQDMARAKAIGEYEAPIEPRSTGTLGCSCGETH